MDGRGGVYLLTEEGITVIDAAGQKTGMIRTDRYKGNLFSGEKLFGDTEGHVYYFVYEDSGFLWKGFRVEHSEGGSLLEAEGLSGSSRMHSCSVNRGKVAYSLADSFYEYPGETGSAQSLLLWGNSNMLYSYIRDSVIIDSERILVWYEEAGLEGLYMLSRKPVEEIAEREPVVLAAFDPDLSLKEAAVRFNRQNGKYQVFIETYGYSPENAEGAAGRRMRCS